MFFYARGDCVFGVLISVDGLKMDPKKVKAIMEWLALDNVGEVISFHSLASFYKKIIKNFSFVCNVIVETMRGDKKRIQVDTWS